MIRRRFFSCPCGEDVYAVYHPDDDTRAYQHGENPEAVLILDRNEPSQSGWAQIVVWLQLIHAYKAVHG